MGVEQRLPGPGLALSIALVFSSGGKADTRRPHERPPEASFFQLTRAEQPRALFHFDRLDSVDPWHERTTGDGSFGAQRMVRLHEELDPRRASRWGTASFRAVSTPALLRDQQPAHAPTTGLTREPAKGARQLPSSLGRSLISLFSRESILPAAVTAGGAALASTLDDEVHEVFEGRRRFESLSEIGETAGNHFVLAGTYGGLFVLGQVVNNERFRSMTYALAQAGVWTNVITFGLKVGVGRERPNLEDARSFPSGHAANMVSIAVVASHYYGKKLAIPLYSLAGFVAVSRIEENAHWLSDVVAGAGLGYLVGRAVIRANDPHGRSRRITWYPLLGRRLAALRIVLKL